MDSKKNWNSQYKYSYNLTKDVEKKFNITLPYDFKKTEKKFPILIPEYYLNLIDINNILDDPIWKQCMPNIKELQDTKSSPDPLFEEPQMPIAKLIHRYKDRVVMLSTSRCSMQCRFCFRKRYWKNETKRQDITDNELDIICNYLSSHPEIREVLVSGGDPLIISTIRLKFILDRLTGIKNIEIIRIASRVPVTLPSRINKKLTEMISKYTGLWFVTHFNHPKEITPQSIKACQQITNSGIPMLNQTVLLKGINDNADILEDLFRKLIKIKVKPHYLFHVDPVKGVKHFATGIECGLEIIRKFRYRLSSIAVPHFAIDLPKGGGKVALQPDYTQNGGYSSIDGKTNIEYYT